MTMRSLLSLSFIFALALFAAGCAEEESTAPTNTTPQIPLIQIKPPTSTDEQALQPTSYVQAINSLLIYPSLFQGMQPTANGGTFTWTIAQGELTITMTAVRQADGSFVWALKLNGMTSQEQTFDNFTWMSGTTSSDGKTGSFDFFEEGTTTKSASLQYSVSATGVVNATLRLYDLEGSVYSKYVGVGNPDDSGSIDAYEGENYRYYRAVWLANGSGTWTTYDVEGQVTGTGSWT